MTQNPPNNHTSPSFTRPGLSTNIWQIKWRMRGSKKQAQSHAFQNSIATTASQGSSDHAYIKKLITDKQHRKILHSELAPSVSKLKWTYRFIFLERMKCVTTAFTYFISTSEMIFTDKSTQYRTLNTFICSISSVAVTNWNTTFWGTSTLWNHSAQGGSNSFVPHKGSKSRQCY